MVYTATGIWITLEISHHDRGDGRHPGQFRKAGHTPGFGWAWSTILINLTEL
jgi:hypothetical protein